MVQLLSFDTAFRPASQGIFLGKRIRTSPEALDFTGVSRLVLIIGYWHTFASLLINQDVPLINVSNFLGHSDLSTTANIYAHLDKASKQASAAVISDILQGENQHAQPEGEPETNTDRQT